MRIVQAVAVGKDPIALAFGACRRLRGGHQIVFPVRDRRDQLLEDQLIVLDQAFGQLFQERHLIGIVKQGEVRLHSQRGVFAFNDIQPQGVEGGDHQAARLFASQRLADTLFHFARRFIGKGHRRDMARLITAAANEVGNFIGDNAGFTGTCPCQHQAWSSNEFDRLLLSRV